MYFLDRVGEGLAVGGVFHLSFIDFNIMQLHARGGWAFPIIPEIYVMPHVSMGLGYIWTLGVDQAAFDLGFGVDAVASFGQFFAFVRPLHFDFLFQGKYARSVRPPVRRRRHVLDRLQVRPWS